MFYQVNIYGCLKFQRIANFTHTCTHACILLMPWKLVLQYIIWNQNICMLQRKHQEIIWRHKLKLFLFNNSHHFIHVFIIEWIRTFIIRFIYHVFSYMKTCRSRNISFLFCLIRKIDFTQVLCFFVDLQCCTDNSKLKFLNAHNSNYKFLVRWLNQLYTFVRFIFLEKNSKWMKINYMCRLQIWFN